MSKVYTFWSVNGGVGKTTLSSVTAYNIAKNNKNKKVLLIDYNLVNPDTDIHLKIPKIDLKDLYSYFVAGTMNEIVLTDFIKEYPKLSNFHILTGLYDINFFDKFRMEHFLTIVEIAKGIGYDYIFLDIDSSVHIDATFVALTNADRLFVVTDGMYHSLRNTNRYIESILSKINIYDKDLDIIVNKFDSEISNKDEIKRILGRGDAHFISFNKSVLRCVNAGIPFVECKERQAKKLIKEINDWTNYVTSL